jgi:Zn-dependent metalloprotease
MRVLAALLLAVSVAPGAYAQPIVSGVLTPPSNASPVAIARAFLATQPAPLGGVDPGELRLERARAIPRGGALVRFVQARGGVDVAGAVVAVRLDAGGRVRWIHSHIAPLPAGFVTVPRVGAAAAIAAAAAGRALAATPATELVIWRPGPKVAPRLVWRVWLPASAARLESLRVIVDAATGKVLGHENLVDHDRQALVFEENPATTPALTQVTLDLPAGSTSLANADFVTHACVDDGTCRLI